MTKAEVQHELDLTQAELSRREKRIMELLHAIGDAVKMLDASSFGGHKPYRCLTPQESERLEEIRDLSLGV